MCEVFSRLRSSSVGSRRGLRGQLNGQTQRPRLGSFQRKIYFHNYCPFICISDTAYLLNIICRSRAAWESSFAPLVCCNCARWPDRCITELWFAWSQSRIAHFSFSLLLCKGGLKNWIGIAVKKSGSLQTSFVSTNVFIFPIGSWA